MTATVVALLAALAAGAQAPDTARAPMPPLRVEPAQPLGIPAGASTDGKPLERPAETQPYIERHLENIRQLTFGGENAEAYFSFDGKELSFQSSRPPYECDQIFRMTIDGKNPVLVSTGKGRTTCSYFFPDGKSLLFSSTHAAADSCPPRPDFSKGYVWALYPTYDIYHADRNGKILGKLTNSPGYDAEATISPDGKHIVFTSDRDGDLELYSMNLDGSHVKRLTNVPGYDGGAFYSPDSKLICYRAHHPTDAAELAEYRSLLAEHLIKPGKLDIMVMNADGTNPRVVLSNGAANFAPFFHPSGKKIIFASNVGDPAGRNFDLYIVDLDGSHLEQVTTNETFDGFPMFSPDGRSLVFASNRNGKVRGETNIFIADWKE